MTLEQRSSGSYVRDGSLHARLKVAAIVGVCDEVELIAAVIANLRNVGVDHVFVVDTGSTDGTLDILADYKADSDITLHCLTPGQGDNENSAHAIADLTASVYATALSLINPDRVIMLDGDEFCIPRSGNLIDTERLLDTDVLRVPRYNVPRVRGVPVDIEAIVLGQQDKIQIVTDPVKNAMAALKREPDLSWIMAEVQPKVLFRADPEYSINVGAHRVDGAGKQTTEHIPPDLVIAHAPFTSRDRFVRKVKNIQRLFTTQGEIFKGNQAWTWKRWAKLMDEREIEAEFERQMLSHESFSRYRRSGAIESAQQYFERQQQCSTHMNTDP